MRLQVRRASDGMVVRDTGWWKNLVVNQGLDALAQQADVMTWFHVGTSSTPPTVLDTWLAGWLSSSNALQSNATGTTTSSPFYAWRRSTMRFPVGTATGNLSEVGVGWSSTSGTLFARSLIQDELGDPTTITVLANEFLDFSYEIRYIVPTTDWTAVQSIAGENYNITMRAANCTSTTHWATWVGKKFEINNADESYHRCYEGNIGAVSALPGGEVTPGVTSASQSAYVTGNYYRDFTVVGYPSDWNPPGGKIKSLVLSCKGTRWQAQFAKVSDGTGIAKSGANTLTANYRVHWAAAA